LNGDEEGKIRTPPTGGGPLDNDIAANDAPSFLVPAAEAISVVIASLGTGNPLEINLTF
jgi:hypothetical protein